MDDIISYVYNVYRISRLYIGVAGIILACVVDVIKERISWI